MKLKAYGRLVRHDLLASSYFLSSDWIIASSRAFSAFNPAAPASTSLIITKGLSLYCSPFIVISGEKISIFVTLRLCGLAFDLTGFWEVRQ